jgi:hypothetical protein
MSLKEIAQGVLISKQRNLFGLIGGIIATLIGAIAIITTLPSPDFSQPQIIVGIIFLVIGIIALLTWKSIIMTLDKNQNITTIQIKRLVKKQEKKYALNDIKEIVYSEQIYRDTSNNTRRSGTSIGVGGINVGGGTLRYRRRTEMLLANGEIYTILTSQGRYNPLAQDRLKLEAKQIAEFTGAKFTSRTLGDALQNVTNKIFGTGNNQTNTMSTQPQNQNTQQEQQPQNPNNNL